MYLEIALLTSGVDQPPLTNYLLSKAHWNTADTMTQNAASLPEVLLVIMPWEVPIAFLEHASIVSPGITVISHKCTMYETQVPADISQDTWDRVTVLFTWNSFPEKEQAPNLQYVQLLSAGANQVADKPIFTDTDITFCVANGVHP